MRAAVPSSDVFAAGDAVVICRYVTQAWLAAIAAARPTLSRVVLFLDDDLAGATVDRSLPARLRLKIWRFFGRHVNVLSELCDQIWVSTEALAHRYPDALAVVVPPVPVALDRIATPRLDWYSYHASQSHASEVRWLQSVIRDVRKHQPSAIFELAVDRMTTWRFRAAAGVRLAPELSWPDYLERSATVGAVVGLAPLVDAPFNAFRAPVKAFDITRIGAVGVFANRTPYRDFIRNGQDGVLLDDAPRAWAEAICNFLQEPDRARDLHRSALIRWHNLARMRLADTPLKTLLNR